ncbi:galactokinase [Sphingobacterium faecale]|uniref:Galactokinase n=1 Tax=Sphingobacterium faecale TaxID=2803775 RepID=A0ABS1R5K8_9SPHI|nr:galactokinase [Sphingobacterium faecale]MBL1409282.1 galactokinase [Sphingobacterium faecale]
MIQIHQLKGLYLEQFGSNPAILAKSPGRINIIGEHTDYNLGLVLPAAINKYIYIAVGKRSDFKIHLYSADYTETYRAPLADDPEAAPIWAKYVIGIAQILKREHIKLEGFNAYIIGDVPLGAGLSSSAALTCVTGFALNHLYNLNLSRLEIAKFGQQTEHENIGVKCGLMDQFASCMGKKNNLIKLDCQDLSFKYIPADWSNYEILLLNTNVHHSLASSAYNDRRAACEQGVAWVKEHHSSIQSLRDISIEQLERYVKPRSVEIYTKCKFIIQENQRLQDACISLTMGDFKKLGELMFKAHWALSKEYEVSCDELDFLIESAENNHEVIGARMMGGGFGGCTINIIQKGRSQPFIQEVAPKFKARFGFELTPIHVAIADGASLIQEY